MVARARAAERVARQLRRLDVAALRKFKCGERRNGAAETVATGEHAHVPPIPRRV